MWEEKKFLWQTNVDRKSCTEWWELWLRQTNCSKIQWFQKNKDFRKIVPFFICKRKLLITAEYPEIYIVIALRSLYPLCYMTYDEFLACLYIQQQTKYTRAYNINRISHLRHRGFDTSAKCDWLSGAFRTSTYILFLQYWKIFSN